MPALVTVSSLLTAALDLPALPDAPEAISGGSLCEVRNCGRPIAAGYRRRSVISDATGEYLDSFPAHTRWVCEACARVMKAQAPHGNYLMGRAWWVFADGAKWDPLLSRPAAREAGRACWSDLVRALWPARAGREGVLLLTTDGKKRTWPLARVGCLGERTPVMLHNTKAGLGAVHSGTLVVSWPRLLECLGLVEEAYSRGIARHHILSGAWGAGAAKGIGLAEAGRWERELRPWRAAPEFAVAVILMQRREETHGTDSDSQ